MGLAIALAQYLLDHAIPYELVPRRITEATRPGAAMSAVPADNVVKSNVLKAEHGFLIALVPASWTLYRSILNLSHRWQA